MAKTLPTKFHEVTHCIFDLDGLLLDTESIYEEVVKEIATACEKPYPQEVRLKVLGTTELFAANVIVRELDLPMTVADYTIQYQRLCCEKLSNANLKKGAEVLLRHLHANNIPIALATSSGEESVKLKTSKHKKLFNLFNHQVCGSTDFEVKSGKPAPDIFFVTASRFSDKPDPHKCLVFEDSPSGVVAAFSAGMQCVMVPEEHTPTYLRNATQVLLSLEEFKPEDFGLPPYKAS